jgi:hypothetical protein
LSHPWAHPWEHPWEQVPQVAAAVVALLAPFLPSSELSALPCVRRSVE